MSGNGWFCQRGRAIRTTESVGRRPLIRQAARCMELYAVSRTEERIAADTDRLFLEHRESHPARVPVGIHRSVAVHVHAERAVRPNSMYTVRQRYPGIRVAGKGYRLKESGTNSLIVN